MIGEKVSQIRKEKAWSQEDLAERSGLSVRTIQRIEKNGSKPRPFTVQTLASALDVDVTTLLSKEKQRGQAPAIDFSILRQINLAVFVHVVLPLGNIFLPLIIWRKNRQSALVKEVGSKIITVQILWTLTTLLLLVLTPLISLLISGEVQVGQFPAVLFVYLLSVVLNVLMTIQSAQRLLKQQVNLYPTIPTLF